MNELSPWLVLLLLGAYHGINPGMGWLFATALGLQERRRSAVIRALGPIALGHAASVALVVAVVLAAGMVVPAAALRVAGAGVLIGFGFYKLLTPMSHPRWVGMRVTARDLTAWSFLMATAHGAGLMLAPVLFRIPGDDASAAAHDWRHHHGLAESSDRFLRGTELLTVLVHSAGMFLVMGLIALVVYEWVGLGILRCTWLNVDRLWAVMLLATGGFTLIL